MSATPGPWSVSEARTVEGEYMVVGGEGQGFGLIASCTLQADAELIVRLRNQCGVQTADALNVARAYLIEEAGSGSVWSSLGNAKAVAAIDAALALSSANQTSHDPQGVISAGSQESNSEILGRQTRDVSPISSTNGK